MLGTLGVPIASASRSRIGSPTSSRAGRIPALSRRASASSHQPATICAISAATTDGPQAGRRARCREGRPHPVQQVPVAGLSAANGSRSDRTPSSHTPHEVGQEDTGHHGRLISTCRLGPDAQPRSTAPGHQPGDLRPIRPTPASSPSAADGRPSAPGSGSDRLIQPPSSATRRRLRRRCGLLDPARCGDRPPAVCPEVQISLGGTVAWSGRRRRRRRRCHALGQATGGTVPGRRRRVHLILRESVGMQSRSRFSPLLLAAHVRVKRPCWPEDVRVPRPSQTVTTVTTNNPVRDGGSSDELIDRSEAAACPRRSAP